VSRRAIQRPGRGGFGSWKVSVRGPPLSSSSALRAISGSPSSSRSSAPSAASQIARVWPGASQSCGSNSSASGRSQAMSRSPARPTRSPEKWRRRRNTAFERRIAKARCTKSRNASRDGIADQCTQVRSES
jgi:hypothetical protein